VGELKELDEVKEKILEKIWEIGKPVTVREVSEKMGLSARSVNMHLLGLRKTGLVVRSGSGYIITEEGKEKIGFQKIDEKTVKKILDRTPRENVFHFYVRVDQPLGTVSDCLSDLCEKIKSIDIRSIEFHTARGDFESWIRYLGDVELSKRLRLIKDANLSGEALRAQLYATLKSRYAELLGKMTER